MMGNKYWAIFNGSETVKRCSQYYVQKCKIISLDSINQYDINEYRYAIYRYGEIEYIFLRKNRYSISGREGFYIFDRKEKLKYPLFGIGGRRFNKKLFRIFSE